MSLVLDVGDGTLLAPVDLLGAGDGSTEGDLLGLVHALGFTLVVSFGVVVDLELFGGQVGELVVAELGEGVLGGHGVGGLHVGVVDDLALGVLSGGEGLVVELLVLSPRRVGEGHLDESTEGDDDDGEAVVENLHFF